jgi:hypothetical protein
MVFGSPATQTRSRCDLNCGSPPNAAGRLNAFAAGDIMLVTTKMIRNITNRSARRRSRGLRVSIEGPFRVEVRPRTPTFALMLMTGDSPPLLPSPFVAAEGSCACGIATGARCEVEGDPLKTS